MNGAQPTRLNKRVEEICTALEGGLSECEIVLTQTASGGWQLRVYAVALPESVGIGYSDEGCSAKEVEAYLGGVLDVVMAFL